MRLTGHPLLYTPLHPPQGYDYLLGMKLWSLTEERVAALRALLAEKEAELEELRNTTPEQMWSRDLDEVERALDEMDDLMAADAEDEEKVRGDV